MSSERYDYQDDSSKEEQYQRLVNNLKAMIESSDAEKVDLFNRMDDLQCNDCGAYEDVAPQGYRAVYNDYEEQTEHDAFIIIDAHEKTFMKDNVSHCLTSYTYICPLCGLYQTAIQQEEYEEGETPE